MRLLICLCIALTFVSCKQKVNSDSTNQLPIVNVEQIKKYLSHDYYDRDDLQRRADSLGKIAQEDSTRILIAAAAARVHEELFNHFASIDDLNKSVRFRESVVNNTYIHPEKSLLLLAQSYIKQHHFKKADSLFKQKLTANPSKEMQLVMFDVAMELGQYKKAESHLNSVRNETDYNYLIRAAKWNDYKGRLDNTIQYMENAVDKANRSGNINYELWTYSNIADYYGHDGQIQKSYDNYLKTLEIDPYNLYALKGIAWIAYAHDDNPAFAQEILEVLYQKHPSPDYLSFLAELEEYQGNLEAADTLRDKYLTAISKSDYGNMYNTYLIEELLQGTDQDKVKALKLAYREVENRATPETYDLLGYALLLNDKKSDALLNHKENVVRKTHEPVAAFHTALIYKANEMTKEVKSLKAELQDAAYELGPILSKEVERL